MVKTDSLTLELRYCKGLFDEFEFERQKQTLKNKNIKLLEFDQNGIVMNCIEPSTVSLTINDPFVQGILIGVTANYITKFVDWALKSLKHKYILKDSTGSIKQESATLSLRIKIDENRMIDFKFTSNLSDEQQEKSIRKVFEFIQNIPPKRDIFYIEIATYSVDNEAWNILDMRAEIEKNKRRKQNDY